MGNSFKFSSTIFCKREKKITLVDAIVQVVGTVSIFILQILAK